MIKSFSSKQFMRFLMVISAMALGSLMALAWVPSGIHANIPFAFSVDNTRLPAGEYVISYVSQVGPIMEIRDVDNNVSVLFTTESTEGLNEPASADLVFDKIGNKDFLRAIRAEDYVYQLVESRTEKNLKDQGLKAESHKVKCMNMKTHETKSTSAATY